MLYIYSIIVMLQVNACQKVSLSTNNSQKQSEIFQKILHEFQSDTLKLKAAQFLIDNIQWHYSYVIPEDSIYYNAIDSSLKYMQGEKVLAIQKEINRLAKEYRSSQIQIQEDSQVITADFLIQNINNAFKLWNNSPWCSHLDFNDFCEYLLPYRIMDKYIIENWREVQKASVDQSLRDHLKTFQHSTEMANSAFWACKAINQKLKELNPDNSLNQSVPLYKLSTRSKIPYGTCEDRAIIAASVMRSLGIPVGIDFTPQWPFRSLGHTWNVLLANSGKIIPFGGCDTDPDILHKPEQKMAKVYRYTYAANSDIIQLKKVEKKVPATFNTPYIKDVTTEYMRTSTVSIPIRTKNKHDYAYLAVFNNTEWIPICFGKRKGNNFIFENIGRNIAYLPVYYEDGIKTALAEPFILDIKGNLKFLPSNLNKLQNVNLYRKYFLSERMLKYAERCVGGRIEASNHKNFKEPDTLFTIQKLTFQTDSIQIKVNKKYRYWRYISLPKTWCNIAELDFKYQGNSQKGDIIGTDGVYDPEAPEKTDKSVVFDRDPLTFFDAPQDVEYAWVGIDFKRPISIDNIIYTPRNDDNNIRIDDIYELFYWDKNQWISLGVQKAKETRLHYYNIPTNALFLLKDHSRGKEERIFTYENNKQVWW